MEETKDYKRLDELFEKARSSKPVMDAGEIRNLISTTPFASLDNVNPKKSNTSLYFMLIGFALVLTIGGIWYTYSGDPVIVNNENTLPTNVNATTEKNDLNANINQSEIEENNAEPIVNSNENIAESTENVTTPETKVEKHPINDAAKTEVKENTSENAAPKVVTPTASNKTSIVRGSDMEIKISDAGKDITMKVNQDNTVNDLTINGKEIAAEDYKKYKSYVDQGVKIAMDDRANKPDASVPVAKTAEEQKRDDLNTRLFNVFSEQLKKDKLISADKFSFKLTSSEMFIDGKSLPLATQRKYLELFKNTAGRELGGTTFKFEHGLK